VAAAVELLVAGADTPNLRILAGEDRADPREVEEILDATLRDLGLPPLDETGAVLVVARDLARRAIGDEGMATDVAPLIWRLYVRRIGTELPPAFVRLAYAADAVEDLPELPSSMPDFMQAAKAFATTG